jgi:phosphatidylglycerophosphate synthase
VLDSRVRRWVDPVVDRGAGLLSRCGVGADATTVAGFAAGVLAWVALAVQEYPAAAGLILLNRVCDGLDGAVARRAGATDLGAYLDIVLDFVFYSGVVFFFAVGRPEAALPAAFLVFSFVGTGSSFLAFAAVAAKRGLSTEARGKKGIYYLGGLTEGTETIALLLLICLWPGQFEVFAWVFGSLCWLTTVTRVAEGVATFRT